MDHTFREEDRVVIAEFHGVGPFRGTVIQADDEQVEVLSDECEPVSARAMKLPFMPCPTDATQQAQPRG